jgi:hypothetical protein
MVYLFFIDTKSQILFVFYDFFYFYFGADLLKTTATALPKAQAKALHKANNVYQFVKTLRTALHNTFRYWQGTRDMAGANGLTTKACISKVRFNYYNFFVTICKTNDKPTLQQVAWRLGRYMAAYHDDVSHQDIIDPPRSQKQIGKPFICNTTYALV